MLRVQRLLSEHIRQSVTLKPAPGKAGQDQIYSVRQGHSTVAMVRVHNKHRIMPNEPQKWSFRSQLDLQHRIEKEWNSYEKLSAKKLSPKPLWRNEMAMACSLVDGERASRRFVRVKGDFWTLAEHLLDAE